MAKAAIAKAITPKSKHPPKSRSKTEKKTTEVEFKDLGEILAAATALVLSGTYAVMVPRTYEDQDSGEMEDVLILRFRNETENVNLVDRAAAEYRKPTEGGNKGQRRRVVRQA